MYKNLIASYRKKTKKFTVTVDYYEENNICVHTTEYYDTGEVDHSESELPHGEEYRQRYLKCGYEEITR